MSAGHYVTQLDAGGVIRLRVATAPRGQERAGRRIRVGPDGRARILSYTPARTRQAVDEIRVVWALAGCPRVPPGRSFAIRVDATVQRPASHVRSDGTATRAYREIPRRPDVDNILKLVLDALQPDCFADDWACSEAIVRKRYGSDEGLDIRIVWG